MLCTRATVWIGVGLGALALASGACVERLIYERGICGDDVIDRGEVCLGQGARSELRIEGIEGLLLRVADFDGDTHLDLLVIGTAVDESVQARLWRGRGDGSFVDAIEPGLFGCSAYAVAGDIDGDAARDMLVDDCGPTVSVFHGAADGVFTGPEQVFTGLDTRSSAMLDLDDDGQREVLVMGDHPDGAFGIAVSERTGPGSYAPAVTSLLGPAGTEGFDPYGLGFLDYDGDGSYDALLIDSGFPGGLAVARGLEGFAFAPPVPVVPPSFLPTTTMVRDLDLDEVPDVLAFSFEEEALIFLRSEQGQLVERGRTQVPGLATGPAGAGDIDADERVDLLLFEPGTRRLQVWWGQGDGLFDGPQDVELDAPVGQIALVDLDEDGALDIVAGTFEAGTIQILLSDP